MKFTSQIVAAASGSIGGCTYSRNRYGQYIRNRSVPVNPGSVYQDAVRSSLSALSTAWVAELTDAERAAWDVYAGQVPRVDALGNSIFVLGINWFVAVNVLRLQSGFTRIDAAPTQFTGTSMTPPTVDAADPDDYTFNYTATDEWAGAVGGHLYVFVGGPTNPTKNFFKGPFRLALAVNGAVSPPASPATYTAPIPFTAGNKVFARFVAQAADGRLSAPTIASAIVT